MATELVGLLSFDGAVDMYIQTLKFVSWNLKKNDYKILKIGCDEGLEKCTSFNSLSHSYLEKIGKKNICNLCKNSQSKTYFNYQYDLKKSNIKLIKKESDFLRIVKIKLDKSNRAKDVISMKYKNHLLNKIAFFDFSIKEKVNLETKLSNDLKTKFLLGIKDQIILLKNLEILNKKFKLDYLIYINGNYSLNTLARNFFSKKGIKCLSIEIQPSTQKFLNKITIVENASFFHPEYLYKKMSTKESIRNISLRDGKNILNSFEKRIKGEEFNAYTSLNKDKLVNYDLDSINIFINKFQRIHSFFLSSEDEIAAHESSFSINKKIKKNLDYFPNFKSQEEFTKYLINEANSHKKTGFIVRLHPRMAPNKRQNFESIEHQKYKTLFQKIEIPKNIFIVYGDNKVSSFYIIAKSNLVLTSWSTIGLEALLLGKQVITIFPYRCGYPILDLSKQPKNKEEFCKSIFKKSSYGIPIDKKLMSWTHNAYDSQFFVTTTPRNTLKTKGRIYSIIYKLIIILGLYEILASIVNILFNRKLKPDKKLLFKKELVKYPFYNIRMSLLIHELKNYRKNNIRTILKYSKL